jgi:hypothetical protein
MFHLYDSVNRLPLFAFVAPLALALTGAVLGQCPDGWRAGDPLPGVDGVVHAMTEWDPDGNGPQPAMLVVGGQFSVAGRTLVNNIAAWDGDEWRALGAGAGGEAGTQVNALAVVDGLLVAGGTFTHAGTASASNIAAWNGSNWQPLHSGVRNGAVSALLEYNGDLIAAGSFTFAGSVIANRIARWDGKTWSALATGMNSTVTCMVEYQGDLIAGGSFTAAGAAPAQCAARWDGGGWHAMSLPITWSAVHLTQLIVHQGNLIAGAWHSAGGCLTEGGCPTDSGDLHRWDGSAWQSVPGWGRPKGESPVPFALGAYGGQLLASYELGSCAPNCSYYHGVRVQQGDQWPEFAGTWPTNAFAEYNGELIMASPAGEVVAWNGAVLRALGQSGMRLFGLGTHAGAVVAGYSTNSTIQQQHGVARWNGHRWQAIGGAFDGSVHVLTTWKGDLVVGGDFTTIDGAVVNNIARRDAVGAWHNMADGLEFCSFGGCGGQVKDLVEFNGDLIAVGLFRIAGSNSYNIARWDGAQWRPMTTSIAGHSWSIKALAVFGGELIVAGDFDHLDGVAVNHVARWNGTQWQPLGAGVSNYQTSFPTVNDLIVWDGRLVVAGRFDFAGSGFSFNVGAWNGANWTFMGGGLGSLGGQEFANTLTIREGDLVVGGLFLTGSSGPPVSNLARFDGVSSWHPIDGGASGEITNAFAQADQLFISGPFSIAGNEPSPGWAIHGPLCPTGDINLDGVVGIDDLLAVISAWGPCPAFPAQCPADVVPDAHVDVNDLLAVIVAWGNHS